MTTPTTDHRPLVLFVCSQNAARSQMAEGWLRHLADDRFIVRSAGVTPGTVNPYAVRVMAEAGVDLSTHASHGIDEYLGIVEPDYLIIVCDRAADQCPTDWPGARQRLHWFFDDPAAVDGSDNEKHAAFRDTRDAIRHRIEHWIAQPHAISHE